MASAHGEDLFPEARNPEDTKVLNERCLLRTQDGHRVVLVSGMTLAQYAVGDRMSEAHAMVSLIEQGWADQNDVARAFGYSARSARRYQQRFEEGGLAALGRGEGYPRGRARLGSAGRRVLHDLKAQGHSQREIARRLGITEKAVRKRLRRMGWKPEVPRQDELDLRNQGVSVTDATVALPATPSDRPTGADPNLSAFSAAAAESSPSRSLDTDPTDRRGDRLLARLGMLEDAARLFGSSASVPRAGVLVAVPALVASGLFDCAQKIYGSLGPAFFGLRTTLLTRLSQLGEIFW